MKSPVAREQTDKGSAADERGARSRREEAMHVAGAARQLHSPETAPADESRTAPGVVVTYSLRGAEHARSHEGVIQTAISRMLAALRGYDFAGEYDPSRRYPGPRYFVPSDTLVGVEAACELGVRTEDDLFGGVVPFPFVATKAITHPLVEPDAPAPEGWSHGFAQRVRDTVLPGFTVFTLCDARRAGARLLELGPIRSKRPRSAGGHGQVVAADSVALEAALGAIDTAELAHDGLVLEHNLTDVTTYSVGQVRVGGVVATSLGTQRLTTDNRGKAVYGGSDLIVVRGDYDTLLGLDLAPEVRVAVAQARAYDAAAAEEFPGLLASRRNYDVARGRDAKGRWRSGVLEQSWRIGGASGPEVAALEAFRAYPGLDAVRAWCVEAFGTNEMPPPRALLHFRGVDHRAGPITKYTLVEPYVRTR
jgi:hypothetical protein